MRSDPIAISRVTSDTQDFANVVTLTLNLILKADGIKADLVPIRHTALEKELTVGSGIRCISGKAFDGGTDVGYNRMNFRWGNIGTFQISPGSHMWQVVSKYYKDNKLVPITMNFGLPPAGSLLAGAGFDYVILPQGCDEVGIAGEGVEIDDGTLVVTDNHGLQSDPAAVTVTVVDTTAPETSMLTGPSGIALVTGLIAVRQLPQPVPVAGTQLVQVVDRQNRVRAGSPGADRLVPLLQPDELVLALSGRRLEIDGSRTGLDGPLRRRGLAPREPA